MTYENACHACRRVFEWRAARYESPDPACSVCGGVTERLVSAPAVVWSKGLSDYGNKSKETYGKDQRNGGHWVFETKSDESIEKGKPIPRFLQTVSDQRDYCRRQGLMMPSDIPNNLTVDSSGRKYETANRSEI